MNVPPSKITDLPDSSWITTTSTCSGPKNPQSNIVKNTHYITFLAQKKVTSTIFAVSMSNSEHFTFTFNGYEKCILFSN